MAGEGRFILDSQSALRFPNRLLRVRNSNLAIFDSVGSRTHTWLRREEKYAALGEGLCNVRNRICGTFQTFRRALTCWCLQLHTSPLKKTYKSPNSKPRSWQKRKKKLQMNTGNSHLHWWKHHFGSCETFKARRQKICYLPNQTFA